MKKLLLTLVTFLTCVGIGWADETPYVSITTVAANQGSKVNSYDNSWQLKDADNSEHTWTVANFNNNNSSWACIKAGRKNNASTASIATDFAIDASIDRVVVNMSVTSDNASKLTTLKLEVCDDANFTTVTSYESSERPTSATDVTFTITDPQPDKYYRVVFDCASAANGFIQVNSLSYYKVADGDTPITVAKPVISGNEVFFDSQEISITAEDGAKIYYTIDGSEPTTESTQYTEAFSITTTTTVQAIAVAEGKDNSSVASKTFTAGDTYASIADLLAAKPDIESRLAGPLTITSVNYYNLFVRDTSGDGLMLNASGSAWGDSFAQGKTVSNVRGKYSAPTSGITPRFTVTESSALEPQGDEATVEPKSVTAEELASGTDYNQYVKLTNEKVTVTDSNYFVGEIQIYKYKIDPASVLTDGISYDLEGMYVLYGSTKELQLISASVHEGESVPETPVVTYNGEIVTADAQLEVWPGETIDVLFASATSYVINDADAVEGSSVTIKVEDTVEEVKYTVHGVNTNGAGATFSFSYKVKQPADLAVSFNGEAIDGDTYEIYDGGKVTLSASGATSYLVNDEAIEGSTYVISTFGTPITFAAKNAAGTITKAITFSEGDADIYELVTSTDGLKEGGRYIIANTANGKALDANNTKSNNFGAVNVTINVDNIINPASDALVIELVASTTTENAWQLKAVNGSESNIGKYLYSSASQNYLKLTSKPSETSDYAISFDDSANATITNATTSKTIKYNATNTLFSSYASGQQDVQLYRLTTAVPVELPQFYNEDGTTEFDLEGTHSAGEKVVVKVNKGLHILYKTVDTTSSSDNSAAKSDEDWTSTISQTDPTTYTYELKTSEALWVKAENGLGAQSEAVGIVLNADGSATGVDNISVVGIDGVVEYFNMQGVRVVNPQNGLYIRRQGSRVDKVVIRN